MFGFIDTIENIIADVWQQIQKYEKKQIPLTCTFKLRSKVHLAIDVELMAILYPTQISIRLYKLLDNNPFTDFICPCGRRFPTEYIIMRHFRKVHFTLLKLFQWLRYCPIPQVCGDLSEIAFKPRPALIGTLDE